jgi:hypothetical protein
MPARLVVHKRGLVRIAQIEDEIWLDGVFMKSPEEARGAVKKSALKADIFTFAQKLPDTEPRYSYHMDPDNLAVTSTSDYKAWWESLPQESRKNVRRAERRGVTIRIVNFTDEFARGVKEIYDETPIRQGRRFWHYRKDLATVRKENSTYLERSRIIAAFHQAELIGFIKMVYVGKTARIMQIIAKNAHADKRPTNALLARAIQTCSEDSITHLIYGQFIYDKKLNSPVTEFKKRNGFHEVLLPRYYLPLTWKGRVAIAAGLHRGIKVLLPEWALSSVLKARLAFYERVVLRSRRGLSAVDSSSDLSQAGRAQP